MHPPCRCRVFVGHCPRNLCRSALWQGRTVSRILFWIHLAHLLFDLSNIIGNVVVPKDTRGMGRNGNAGDMNSWGCVKAFWGHGIYRVGHFSLHYTSCSCFAITPGYKLKKMEPYLHSTTWVVVAVTTFVPTFYEAYNESRRPLVRKHPFELQQQRYSLRCGDANGMFFLVSAALFLPNLGSPFTPWLLFADR